MAEYLTNTTDLTKVASAIREKGGTSDPLVYPDGFVTAIENIQTGGGGGATALIVPKDITFFDCDGTVIDAWTMEELQAKTALPEIPAWSGWSAGYWNWTLEQLQTQNLPMDVAVQRFPVNSAGAACIRICLPEGRLTLGVTLCLLTTKAKVEVDFGDGTTAILNKSSSSSPKYQSTYMHTYPAPGYYDITLTRITGSYSVYGEQVLFGKSRASSNTAPTPQPADYVYLNAIQEAPFSISIYNTSARIDSAVSKSKILLGVNWIKFSSLHGASGGFTANFKNCASLQRVSIGHSGNLGSFDFTGCTALTVLKMPWSASSGASLPILTGCRSLTALYAGASDTNTSIKANMFSGCTGMKLYDFSRSTVVIPLNDTNAFEGIPSDCQIRVPASLVDEWKAATNWSIYADYIVGV